MAIHYKTNHRLKIRDIAEVYDSSGIRRPTGDYKRLQRMFNESNLVLSAWDGELLTGVARSLTDFCYCCYLSDLAVRKEYQHKGIGKELIRLTKEYIGEHTMLLLLSAPEALDYYPKTGMEKAGNAFIIKRTK